PQRREQRLRRAAPAVAHAGAGRPGCPAIKGPWHGARRRARALPDPWVRRGLRRAMPCTGAIHHDSLEAVRGLPSSCRLRCDPMHLRPLPPARLRTASTLRALLPAVTFVTALGLLTPGEAAAQCAGPGMPIMPVVVPTATAGVLSGQGQG